MDGTPHPSPSAARRLAAALLALLAIALCAGTAVADDGPAAAPQDRWPVGGAAVATASELAGAHWGMTPCHGHVALTWAHLPAPMNAQSDWAYVNRDPYARPAANSDCSIELSLDADWDWPKLCTVIVHEVGHLTGHDHVADITDVMSANYAGPVAECAATDEPAAGDDVLGSYLSAPLPAAAAKVAAKPKAAPKAKAGARAKKLARRKARPARS